MQLRSQHKYQDSYLDKSQFEQQAQLEYDHIDAIIDPLCSKEKLLYLPDSYINGDMRAALLSRRSFTRYFLSFAAIASLFGLSPALSACNFSKAADSNKALQAVGDSVLSTADSGQDEIAKSSIFAFDTLIMFSAYGSKKVLDVLAEDCAYYEMLFSAHKEGTDISRINAAQGRKVEVDIETAQLIEQSLKFSEKTAGKFDITVGSASLLWDFKKGIKPSQAELDEAIKHIDYTKVLVEGNTVQLKDPQAKLDLGATAKGWIADKLKQRFLDFGISSGLINLGGNVYAIGTKPDGSAWNIAVRDPNTQGQSFLTILSIKDASVVTSGLYERYFDLEDKRYTHILDAHTGYPVETDILADTVVGSSSFYCDAYSTSLFVDGLDAALKLINAEEELEALFVDKKAQAHFSEGFKTKYPQALDVLKAHGIDPL